MVEELKLEAFIVHEVAGASARRDRPRPLTRGTPLDRRHAGGFGARPDRRDQGERTTATTTATIDENELTTKTALKKRCKTIENDPKTIQNGPKTARKRSTNN